MNIGVDFWEAVRALGAEPYTGKASKIRDRFLTAIRLHTQNNVGVSSDEVISACYKNTITGNVMYDMWVEHFRFALTLEVWKRELDKKERATA